MNRVRYTHVAFPVWQGVHMSLGEIRGRIPAPRRGSPAAGRPAPARLETLESRQLLSAAVHAHGVAVSSACAGQSAPVQAVAFTQSALSATGQVVRNSSTTCPRHAATAPTANEEVAEGRPGDVSAAPTVIRADGTAPVERLADGSQFHGYDYIPPDGSAPPPLPPPDLSHLPTVLSKPDQNKKGDGSLPPKSVKPSIEPGGQPSDSGGLAPTPLAQTPAAAGSTGSPMGEVRESISVPDPGPVISPASSAANAARVSLPVPAPSTYVGTVAMAMPAGVILAAHTVTPAGISEGLAYATNRAADALSLVATPDGIAGTAAYNFVHFNPALLLNDAIAAFTRDSASLSAVQMPVHSATRAWLVTGAVVAADLLLVGCWYRNRRQQKSVRSTAPVPVQPTRVGVLRRRRHSS